MHHDNPFLRLAPFKLEILLAHPFRSILRDILTENEINHMLESSAERLSRGRPEYAKTNVFNKRGDNTETVHKSVQVMARKAAHLLQWILSFFIDMVV